MKRALMATAMFALVGMMAAPAAAEVVPVAGGSDARVRFVDYNPTDVIAITGVLRTATQILFSADEQIQHVALGDKEAWEIAAEGNILFLKPTEAHPPTNLIVSTRRGELRRNYTFELTARPGAIGSRTPNTFFQVRFRYPNDERAARQAHQRAEAASQLAAVETRVMGLELGLGVLDGPRNFAYSGEGATSIQPSEISDNGRFTVMRFPASQSIPAIFAVAPDGTEGLVPFDVRGEFVVIHATAQQFRLRRGREVLCIFNEALSFYGTSTGTGTASSAVERITAPEGK